MNVRYFGGAAEAAGRNEDQIDNASLTTVSDLIDQLSQDSETLSKVLRVSALLADGVRVEDSDNLRGLGQTQDFFEVFINRYHLVLPFAGE